MSYLRESRSVKKKQMDMLQGSLLDKMILFALPIAASSILQQLFNSVDVAVVGRFDCSQAQAAVGCNGALINLLLNLFVGISIGTNVVIASYIGQNQKEHIKDTVHTSMLVAVISGFILLVLGMFVAKPALLLLNTPDDVLSHAILYLRIYFMGMPFMMVYNFGASILRSIGDTKRPLYCLLVSGITNAVLNLILVIVFHLGVAGVAIATVVANLINSIIMVNYLVKETGHIKLYITKLHITKVELIKMLKIGIPAGLQGMVFSIANLFIQKALNSYGSDAVAGSAVTLNYEFFTYFIIAAFNQTTVTFTSQNYAARNYDRCKRVYRMNFIMSLVLSGVFAWTIVLGRGFFIGLFTTKKEVAKYAAIRMIRILTLNCLVSTYEISGSALRGMGYSMTPAILTVFGTCIFRLVWIATVCKKYRSFAVLLNVYPITWVITGTAVMVAYFIVRRKCFRTEEAVNS